MEYQIHLFPNGLRLLHVPVNATISHACFLVKAGSRHERPGKEGIAHFIEHMLFKRTQKRSTNQILNRLESVGADLNAYTTKEYTCIHASFLKPFLARTLELFSDVLFRSTFPEDELEKERGIVLDEIASYQDQPEEAIYDDFEDMLFQGHPLGHNILGTESSVSAFSRQDILDFIHDNYDTSEMIIGVLGNYPMKQVVNAVTRHFDVRKENLPGRQEGVAAPADVKIVQVDRPISQAHVVLGNIAYDVYSEHKTPLLLLNNMLGGNGMSSMLNLQVREKHGIAYTIESGYAPLSDTGLFTVYFGTDPGKTEKALKLVYKEFRKLKDSALTEVQLQKAKIKFIGQIALGEENRMGMIISMSKSLLDHDTVDSLETVFNKIRAVTASEMLAVANEILDERRLSMLTFYPLESEA